MTDNYSGFCAWLASFLQKSTVIHQSFRQKMQRRRIYWGEGWIKIGLSVHRPIG